MAHFEFHQKSINGVIRGFMRQQKGFKHSGYIISHVSAPKKVSGEKYGCDWRSQKMPSKPPKFKLIIHAFLRLHDPYTGGHEMPPGDMGGHYERLP